MRTPAATTPRNCCTTANQLARRAGLLLTIQSLRRIETPKANNNRTTLSSHREQLSIPRLNSTFISSFHSVNDLSWPPIQIGGLKSKEATSRRRDDIPKASKRAKSRFPPPKFWDSLSKMWFTRRALRANKLKRSVYIPVRCFARYGDHT
jgi:hypothetical protein